MKLKIAPKILLAFLLSIIILSMAVYLRWNFEQGFLDYLQQIEIEQTAPLQKALSKTYDQEGGWKNLHKNHRLWGQVLNNALPGL